MKNLPDPNLPDNPNGDIYCEICGYKGDEADFEQISLNDTICPRCGESQEHVYEV